MKKRVVQVVQHLRPGGIETMALDLQAFAPQDTEVIIVSLEGQATESILSWPPLQGRVDSLVFLDKPPGLRPGTLFRLFRLFRRLRPQAVHTHHIGPLLYGGLAARLAGVPTVIHTEHDAWHLEEPRRQQVERFALTLVKPIVVADARFVAEALQKATEYPNALIIPNGVDTRRFSPGDRSLARETFALPQQVPVVGCAARLTEVKGHQVLLHALAKLDPTVELALAGSGPEEAALRRLASELGLSRRIHFLGRVDDMPSFYRALDVFCLPSLAEGMPLSPLEAQACAIPVVVTGVGGAPEAVCPETGSVVPPRDAEALAAALRQTLQRETAPSPRQFVTRHGDVANMVQSYHALLNQH